MEENPPSLEYRAKASHELDEIYKSISRANAAAIAGCIAILAQDINITWPLFFFLISGLSFGLLKIANIFLYHEVWSYYLNAKEETKEWSPNLPKFLKLKKNPHSKSVENFCMHMAFYLELVGRVLLPLAFLAGAIGSIITLFIHYN